MKKDIIVDFEALQMLAQINLANEPNQDFNVFINDKEYNIEIRTMLNNKTFITIESGGETLCYMNAIKCNIDLIYTSKETNILFFFLNEKEVNKNFDYTDFGVNVGLYYGVI